MRLRTRTKYGAVKTTVDGIVFDSKKEAHRYGELKLLVKAGQIHDLQLQPQWVLTAGRGVPVGKYRGDFSYCECDGGARDCTFAKPVVEDVKGVRTPLYRWKAKHLRAEFGIVIREV